MIARFSRQLRLLACNHRAYYAGMLLAGFLGLAKSVGYGLVLTTTDFGLLSLANSISLFVVFVVSRGVVEGAALELPRLYGLGQMSAAAALLHAAMRRLAVETMIAAAIALAALALRLPWTAGWLALPFAGSTAALSLAMSDARSRGALGVYGNAVLTRTALSALLGLPAAYLVGFEGVVLAETVGQLILACWLLRRIRTAEPNLRYTTSTQVNRRGFQMMQHQLLQTLQVSGDKWVVSAALGPEALGQYGFASIFAVATSLLHAILYQQIGPAALRSVAEGQCISAVTRHYNRVAISAALGVGALGVGVWGVFWWAQQGPLARYDEALAVFPIVVITAMFQMANHHDWIIATGPRLGVLMNIDVAATVLFFGFAGIGWIAAWPLVYFASLACVVRGALLLVSLWLANATGK